MILKGLALQLRLWDVNSLKEKRKIVKSIIDKIHHHYKISAAEVDLQDSLTYAVIGIGMVTNDHRHADQVLQKISRAIEANYGVDLVDIEEYEDY